MKDYSTLISVVIPTYQRTDLLYKALKSVSQQTYPNFECIVVNDHPPSKDTVNEVLNKLQDPRFKVVHHEQNLGTSKSKNTGIRAAKGEIIAFLDDDDSWENEFLKMHALAHKQHADAGLAYCGFYYIWQDSLAPKEACFDRMPELPLSEAIAKGLFSTSNGSILSIKKKCLDEIGLYDPKCESFEDWDMLYRISLHYQIIPIDSPLTNYYIHFKERLTASIDKRHTAYLAAKEKHQLDDTFNTTILRFLIFDYYRYIRESVILGHRRKATKVFSSLLFTQGPTWRLNLKTTLKITLLVVLGKRGLSLFRYK